jgi:hypothetical protein
MSAIDHGSAEALMDRIQMDEGRANEILQAIEDDTFDTQPPRPVFPDEDPGPMEDEYGNPIPQLDESGQPMYEIDPMTGQPAVDPATGQPQIQYVPATEVPGWMPRPFDRIPVHRAIFEDYMKSQSWALLDDRRKTACMAYYTQLLAVEAQQAAKAQAQQMQQAMELGEANAARPTDKGSPDKPGGSGQNGQQSGQLFAPRYQFGQSQPF